jgi:hypothetical protein
MTSEVWLCVLGAVIGNNRVGVTVTHLVFSFQECDLFHVGQAGNLCHFFHPEIDWLAILLFDRRKVGGWAFDFFIHADNLTLSSVSEVADIFSQWSL